MSRRNPTRDRLNRILTAPRTPLEQLQQEYLRSLILRNCSDRTIEYWAMNLVKFNRWCEERGSKGEEARGRKQGGQARLLTRKQGGNVYIPACHDQHELPQAGWCFM